MSARGTAQPYATPRPDGVKPRRHADRSGPRYPSERSAGAPGSSALPRHRPRSNGNRPPLGDGRTKLGTSFQGKLRGQAGPPRPSRAPDLPPGHGLMPDRNFSFMPF
jgi:hypothetical protein